jgi:hypothetical protein
MNEVPELQFFPLQLSPLAIMAVAVEARAPSRMVESVNCIFVMGGGGWVLVGMEEMCGWSDVIEVFEIEVVAELKLLWKISRSYTSFLICSVRIRCGSTVLQALLNVIRACSSD